jgi:hypothetical protein
VTATVIAQVTDQLGHAMWEERDAFGHRRIAKVGVQPLADYCDTQPGDVEIRLRHSGPRIGYLDYLEVGRDGGDLVGVGVVDVEPEVVEDLFCSAELRRIEVRCCDRPAFELCGLAITGATAGVGARPLVVLPGDYRRPVDRGYWSRAPEIIERAAAATPTWQRWRRPDELTIHTLPVFDAAAVAERARRHDARPRRPARRGRLSAARRRADRVRPAWHDPERPVMRRPQRPLSPALAMMVEEWEKAGPASGEWITREKEIRPPDWRPAARIPPPNWDAEEAERQRQLAAEHDH